MSANASGKTPFYITTAISYVNGPPHLGHAYEAIATDVIARFKRLDGYDVRFLTGTDEHGQKVEKTAREAGKEPRAFSDAIAAKFQAMTGTLNISNDDFIRTTEEKHYVSSQGIWSKLQENGDIYLDKYAGWYSVRDEAFFAEGELTRTKTAHGTPLQAPRSSGSRRRATSSVFRPTRTSCSPITRPIRPSSSPRPAATRS